MIRIRRKREPELSIETVWKDELTKDQTKEVIDQLAAMLVDHWEKEQQRTGQCKHDEGIIP